MKKTEPVRLNVETPDYAEEYAHLEDGSELENSEYADEALATDSAPEPDEVEIPELPTRQADEEASDFIEPAKEMVKQEVQKLSERQEMHRKLQDEKEKKMRSRQKVPKTAKLGMRDCTNAARWMRRRSVVVALLTIAVMVLSTSTLGMIPMPEQIAYETQPQIFFGILIGAAGLSMLLGLDIILNGIREIFAFRVNFNTLVTASLFASAAHTALLMLRGGEEMPYPGVAMAALFALMRARAAEQTASANTYRAAVINRAPVGIYLHKGAKPHLVKRRLENGDDFVYSTAKDGWYSRFERLYSPLVIVVAVVLSGIITAATGDYGRFPYALSALLCAACQLGLLTAAAFGCSGVTKRLQRDNAAISGMTAAVRLADTPMVVMDEDDLFPAGAIAVDDYIDIRGSIPEEVALSFAASLEGDSALGKVLKEMLRKRYADLMVVRQLERFEREGKGGVIAEQHVLFGTAALMEQQKVIIPALPNSEQVLFLAVNGMLEAIFEVEYIATTQVYTALQSLADRRIGVLFHARDCHLSAERLCDLFGLKPGMIRLPSAEHAKALSRNSYIRNDDLVAVLTRDGAAPYADCVDAACAVSRFNGIGLALGVIAAVLDCALMSYLCYVFAPLSASPIRVLLYSLLWFVPIFFVENEARRG